MGEIIFGITASVLLCVFVGCGLLCLIQDWKINRRAEERKREAESRQAEGEDEPETEHQHILRLRYENWMFKVKIQNVLLRKKLKDLGITNAWSPEEPPSREPVKPSDSSPDQPV